MLFVAIDINAKELVGGPRACLDTMQLTISR
jgi:hypothetical protein